MECKYCKKNFSTQQSLKHHQKNTKKCLEKQKQYRLNLNDLTEFNRYLEENYKIYYSEGIEGLLKTMTNPGGFLRNKDGTLLYQLVNDKKNIFEFLNEKGEIEQDINCVKIRDAIRRSKLIHFITLDYYKENIINNN